MAGRLWSIVLILCAAAAAGEIREDPPVATRPANGDVTGQITPAGRIAGLDAVCRATGKTYRPGKLDRKTGKFTFKGLPGDAAYDLRITTDRGEKIEGIDLGWHEGRMLRLAGIRRKQLGLPPESKHRFSRADADELIKFVRDLKDFANVRRALYVRGNGPRATMLAEVMRTRKFYAQRGDEVIWRTELWYFRYFYGGWERVGNVERVLERHRISESKWRRITKVYYPALSARVDQNGRSKPVKFVLPDPLDPATGRIAGTDPVQKTTPIILGLRKKPDVAPTPKIRR